MTNYYNPYQYAYQYQPQLQNIQQPLNQQAAPQMLPTQMSGTSPQIQNGGFVSVRNEAEARGYPVAPGNSVTFKDEGAPYVYTKTMGFSQLDRPIFEKYRLVRETPSEAPQTAQDAQEGSSAGIYTLEDAKRDIGQIKGEIEGLKNKLERTAKKEKKKEEEEEEQCKI